jgi:hypothetical protein
MDIDALQTAFETAVINGSNTASVDHTFSASSIWSFPVLQRVNDINTDDGRAEAFVMRFDAANVINNVHFIGVFASQCTRVRFGLSVKDCWARALCTTFFIG